MPSGDSDVMCIRRSGQRRIVHPSGRTVLGDHDQWPEILLCDRDGPRQRGIGQRYGAARIQVYDVRQGRRQAAPAPLCSRIADDDHILRHPRGQQRCDLHRCGWCAARREERDAGDARTTTAAKTRRRLRVRDAAARRRRRSARSSADVPTANRLIGADRRLRDRPRITSTLARRSRKFRASRRKTRSRCAAAVRARRPQRLPAQPPPAQSHGREDLALHPFDEPVVGAQ